MFSPMYETSYGVPDQNSNVFVAGNGTNNVVVLSPDGKNCRQILTKDDGLNEPCSLRINIEILFVMRLTNTTS
jgi:hypothetical protein